MLHRKVARNQIVSAQIRRNQGHLMSSSAKQPMLDQSEATNFYTTFNSTQPHELELIVDDCDANTNGLDAHMESRKM